MLMEGIEAIAESAQAAKAEAHSPTGTALASRHPTSQRIFTPASSVEIIPGSHGLKAVAKVADLA
ncbi:putative myb-like DNA-binding domain-containing protein [Colletotrichum tofieldiae]|nr:putative myb-like DNA-binding domain-containing protein [Colletotrichum tofieldiae]GKT76180.1 putative myb-like DNA-binding domain-containing protein [Colletotrichum tofieldiae]